MKFFRLDFMEGDNRETAEVCAGIHGVLPEDFETMKVDTLMACYGQPAWSHLQLEAAFRKAKQA